jgi:16S rRNA A1518/A1519 N6-dimethyltransferase RsmA/KsgA/DIM1 with predicted DNA glycosylase/AP lyase activity
MSITTWEPVKNYEGFYEITTSGIIRSLHKRNYHTELKPRIDRAGYLTVRLNKTVRSETKFVHRLAAETFIPNPHSKSMVNHIDGNKTNNDVENLEWVTHEENIKHAYKSKLIAIKGREIIDTCTGKIYKSIKEAAKDINVNYGTCRNYLNGNIKTSKVCLQYAA